MATEKTFTIRIEEKGFDKLKDNVKDLKIEAISASDMMQKIVKDASNATSKIDKLMDNIYVNTKKLTAEEKMASTIRMKNMAAVDEMFKSFYGQNDNLTKRTAQLSSAASEMVITIEQIQGLNEKNYKTLEKTTAAKLAASQEEIGGLAKNAKSIEQVIKAYEKKKDSIILQNNVAKAAIASEYDAAKKSGGDIVALEKLKNEQIVLIDAKQKKDLTQNAKDYQASVKSLNDKLLSSITANTDVEVKKVSGKIKKEIKDAAADAAKSLGLPQGALKDVAAAAIKAAGETKKATDETKETGEVIAKTAEASAKATEAAAKAAEAANKTIDIGATRKNLELRIQGLDHLRTSLEQTGKAELKSYDEQIVQAGENMEKREKLEAQKVEAIKYYGAEIVKVSQGITVANKKEHDLDTLQWKQYGEKLNTVAGSIQGTMTKTSEYFGSAFSAISNVYKAEIDGIDEDILHLKNKNADFIQEYANHKAEYEAIGLERSIKEKELKAQGLSDTQIANDVEVKAMKERQATEQQFQDENITRKNEIEAKERELQEKKAKKQADQEKIEKLKRKVDLIKSIGDATANIAQGVTKALAYGPFIGTVLAGIVATAGVIQIGIMTKQLAKFEDGGLLSGKRHAQGGMRIEGTNIEVEGGEYVVNRESTSRNMGLMRYINSQRKELTPSDMNAYFSHTVQGYEPPFSRMFESGGEIPTAEVQKNNDNKALLEAIKSIKIEPKVAVTDIHRVQDEMVDVSRWSGM